MNRSVISFPQLSALLRLLSILALCCAAAGCGMFKDAQDETAGWSAQQLYSEAKDAMDNGAYDKAVKYYEKLEARYPYGRLAQQAQIEIAYAYYKENETDSSVAACDRFIKLYPNHANVDYAYYLKGLARFNQDLSFLGRLGDQDPAERDSKAARDSFDDFKELATRYPDSKYTPDALARMRYLLNALALHEIYVARYYMRRDAYVAATSRAQYAIKNYPQAPATEEGLFILVKGYDALGLTDLRDDADRVMRQNFPDSAYIKGTVDTSSQWWKLWK
jgi:outer membrane protein assembly factor BamD